MKLSEIEVAEVLAKYDKACHAMRDELERCLRDVDDEAKSVDVRKLIDDFGRKLEGATKVD